MKVKFQILTMVVHKVLRRYYMLHCKCYMVCSFSLFPYIEIRAFPYIEIRAFSTIPSAGCEILSIGSVMNSVLYLRCIKLLYSLECHARLSVNTSRWLSQLFLLFCVCKGCMSKDIRHFIIVSNFLSLRKL